MAFTTSDSFEDFLNNIQQATAQKQAMTGRNMSQQEMKGLTDSYLKNKIQRDIARRSQKHQETMQMMGLLQRYQEMKEGKKTQKGKNMADLLSSIPMGLLAAKRAMQPGGQPQPQGQRPSAKRPLMPPKEKDINLNPGRTGELEEMMGGGYDPGIGYVGQYEYGGLPEMTPAEMYEPGMFQEWY